MVGVAMRGLMRRVVVAAGAAAVLLGPAVGVVSAAGAAATGTRLAAGRDGSGGTVGTAKEVPGTATLNRGGSAAVDSVSCVSAGNCSAGGYYFDGSGNRLAAILPALTSAVPGQGRARSLPNRLGPPRQRPSRRRVRLWLSLRSAPGRRSLPRITGRTRSMSRIPAMAPCRW